ncbi:hypothetical protein FRC06_005668, partial [Ceratobasidium sp. 370]
MLIVSEYSAWIAHLTAVGFPGDAPDSRVVQLPARPPIRLIQASHPNGSPGRPGSGGYDVQETLGMTEDGYQCVYAAAKL